MELKKNLNQTVRDALLDIGFTESALRNIVTYEPLVDMLNEYMSGFQGTTGNLFEESQKSTHYYDPDQKTVFLIKSSIENSPEYLAVGYLVHEVSHALWDREFGDDLSSVTTAEDYANLSHQNEALAYYRQVLAMRTMYSEEAKIRYSAQSWLDNDKTTSSTDIYLEVMNIESKSLSEQKKLEEIAKLCADLCPIAYGGEAC